MSDDTRQTPGSPDDNPEYAADPDRSGRPAWRDRLAGRTTGREAVAPRSPLPLSPD